jgi:hypothetical protein
MKTAISIPDELFDSAEALASRLGVSRSQLYATALARLLAEHERSRITERLDAIYGDAAREPSRLEAGYAVLQARALRRTAGGAGDAEW